MTQNQKRNVVKIIEMLCDRTDYVQIIQILCLFNFCWDEIEFKKLSEYDTMIYLNEISNIIFDLKNKGSSIDEVISEVTKYVFDNQKDIIEKEHSKDPLKYPEWDYQKSILYIREVLADKKISDQDARKLISECVF